LSQAGEIVDEWASPPDGDGLRGLARRAGMHDAAVRGVIESMNGARFVHGTKLGAGCHADTLEELGCERAPVHGRRVRRASASLMSAPFASCEELRRARAPIGSECAHGNACDTDRDDLRNLRVVNPDRHTHKVFRGPCALVRPASRHRSHREARRNPS
jgi:hypothetical protein